MASSINASLTNGIVTTADTSGNLNLQSNGSTVVAVTSTGAEVTGLLAGSTNYTGFKNRIINGAMTIDQRNAGTATANTINGYTVDRWQVAQSITGKLIAQQNAGSISVLSETEFSKYLGVTSQSAYSIGASDYYTISQSIEAFNLYDLQYGTANAKTVTLSFWVYSSLTGTFGGCVRVYNGSAYRSYPFTYTVSSTNTWTHASVTIAGDTVNTINPTGNAIGMVVSFGLGVGTTYSGTTGSWSTNNYLSATGATSVVGTNGATFYITGVQLEKGSTATSFDYRPYGTELALCQRYYYRQSSPAATDTYYLTGLCVASTIRSCPSTFTQMRSTPTISFSSTAHFSGYDGTSAPALSSVISTNSTSQSIGALVTVASALSTGRVGLLISNSSSAWLDYSSEL